MNIYKEWALKYLEKGISTIPDIYSSKKPAIKDFPKYSEVLPTKEEINNWSNSQEKSNISVMLGPASNLVALDLDTDRPDIMAVIKDMLPNSPVKKRGGKGYTAFFQYAGDNTEKLNFFDGLETKCILEILSTGKKTTIPPSVHESGINYVWEEKSLLEVNVKDLPLLPPNLISVLELELKAAFKGSEISSYGKLITTGRNSSLSSYLGKILETEHTVDETIKKLIQFDKENNTPPYFLDLEEHRHADAATNALTFYTTHLNSFNNKRHRDNKEYITPILASEVSESEPKKLEPQEKSLKAHELIPADSAVKTICETINANSWIKQPELALGATLALGAVVCSRKVTYQGISTNMYISGIAPSSAGKNSGLEFVKQTLIEIGGEKLLGAGDMASDAGITDTMEMRPTQLYVMDEIGGILKSLGYGNAEYNSKMGDILTEMYTVSMGRYLGRALKEGNKGAVDRPHLNILGATTPTGFRQGVSKSSLEKGLMGRFILFFGDSDTPSTRVKKTVKLPVNILNQLSYLVSYRPEESSLDIQGRPQLMHELKATEAADKRLDEIFYEFDQLRLAHIKETIAPIAGRLYQQMIKIVIIHTLLNGQRSIPDIDVKDVEFGRAVILNFFNNFKSQIEHLIYSSPIEKQKADLKRIIAEAGLISKKELIAKTKHLTKNMRESTLDELRDSAEIEIIRQSNSHYYKVV